MNVEALLVFFVGVTAVALVVQSLYVWKTSRTVQRTVERLEQQSQDLERQAMATMSELRAVTEGLEPLRRMADDVGKNVQKISGTVRHRVEDMDQFLEELVQIGREQASKVDFVVSDTVQKFEETTTLIQKDVIRPLAEIAAFIKGVRAGVGYLFSSRNSPTRKANREEEELFI